MIATFAAGVFLTVSVYHANSVPDGPLYVLAGSVFALIAVWIHFGIEEIR